MLLKLGLIQLWVILIHLYNFVNFVLVTLKSLKKLWCVSFFHNCLVSELLSYLVDALHIGVYDLAVLIAVAVLNIVTPLNQMEFHVELDDMHW